jgi:hypothetical protein
LLAGCSTTSTVDTSSNCFGACLDADANVELSVEIEAVGDVTLAFDASRRTLKGYFDGALALGGVAKRLADAKSLSLPAGFSYEGAGVYSVDTGEGAVAEVRFYWPVDASDASVGDLITWNVFDAGNYFTGLSVKTGISASLSSGIDTTFEFGFDEAGPGAELLGLGAAPDSPIDVDVGDMTRAIKATTSSAVVRLEPDAFGVVTDLDLSSVETAVAENGDEPIELAVEAFSGENSDGTQTLSRVTSELSLVDGGDGYLGDFSFNSIGAEFSFDGRLRYDGSASAEVRLGCPGAELSFPDE